MEGSCRQLTYEKSDFRRQNVLVESNYCDWRLINRLVFLCIQPKILKEEIKDRFNARAKELGVPDLLDKVADETVGVTEDTILPFLQEKEHPALKMDPILE